MSLLDCDIIDYSFYGLQFLASLMLWSASVPVVAIVAHFLGPYSRIALSVRVVDSAS